MFPLRIGAVDTTPYHNTKKRTQEAIDRPVRKGKAKKFGLLNSIEWLLTTQKHINKNLRN